jgi:hypothetical protein
MIRRKKMVEGSYCCFTQKELKRIEKNTTLKSIKMHCGNLNQIVEIPWKNCKVISSEKPCELCISHGTRGIEIYCVCGLKHHIILDTW